MSDYSISAEFTADTSGYEAGIKKAQKASKSLGSSVSGLIKGMGKSGLVGALGAVGLATGGVTAIIGVATKAFKAIEKVVNETTEAYKAQYRAEVALETVAKNNPYIDGTSVSALKKYASELQSISNYGDEQLLPLMTNLTALGRTQEETTQIMKVAMDMASSGMISLDSAVTQLNATLNGNIGRLGQQNAELKNLSEEELKSGKAIDILAKKYEGLTEATADSSKQLKNAFGDMKELMGETFNKPKENAERFWTSVINNINTAIKKTRELKKATAEVYDEAGNIKESSDLQSLQVVWDRNEEELTDMRQRLKELQADTTDMSFLAQDAINTLTEEIKGLEAEQEELFERISKLREQEEKERAEAIATAEAEEKEAEINKLKQKYLDKLDEQERKWENIKTVTGEEVELEEKLKFYQDTLVSAMTEANGQIEKGDDFYTKQLATIKDIVRQIGLQVDVEEVITDAIEEQENLYADIGEWEDKLLAQQIERLETMKEMELEQGNGNSYEIETRYAKMILDLKVQQLEKEKELALAKVEGTENAEEARIKIIRYYEEQERLLRVNSSLKVNNQIKEENKKTWKEIAKDISSEMSAVMKKVAKILKNTFGKVKTFFSKLFSFDTDDALVGLLEFEDKILTFFVETVPKLPAFFESALQSVSVLLQNLLTGGNLSTIGNIINAFMQSIARYAPQIMKSLGKIIGTILDQIDFGEIIDWLLNGLISILPDVMKAITKVIKKLVAMLPKILPTLIKAMVTIVTELVKALPSILTSVLPDLLRAVLEMVKALLQHLPEIIKVLIEAIPQIVRAVIEGLIDFISNLSAKDLVDIVVGIIKMTADIALTIIKNIGKLVAELIPALIQLIWELIKAIPDIIVGILEGTWEGLQWVGEKVWSGIQSAGKAIASGAEAVWDGIKSAFGKLKFWASGTDNAPKGLAVVGEQGPELVRFNGGEQVLNTRNTQKALANVGSNSGNQFNVTFNNTIDTTAYALMQQLKQYNRQMAINGVI